MSSIRSKFAWPRFVVFPIGIVAVLCRCSSASLVAPGDSKVIPTGDLTVLPGTVLAESTRPFHIDYINMSGPDLVFDGGPQFLDGSVTIQVIRDSVTHELAFTYSIQIPENQNHHGIETSEFKFTNFAGFTTDVHIDNRDGFFMSRSADGTELTQTYANPGEANPHGTAILTDATLFDERGSLRIFFGDEVVVHHISDPTHVEIGFGSGETTLTGVFGPATASAIPLPPALWTALVSLPAGALSVRRARVHSSQ